MITNIDEIITGYFGRAHTHSNGKKIRGCSSVVHFVNRFTMKPICGYKPHPTMSYQFCAMFAHAEYVKCKECMAQYVEFRKRDTERLKNEKESLRNVWGVTKVGS